MTKEVEDIIRNKAYYELTNDERNSVGEYAQNEEEYNNMQWFLTGTTASFGASKIEATPGLRKGVMEHLTEGKKKKGFWLNSVGLFMLPSDKKFYQKPAFQLGMAAILVVGLLFVLNPEVKDTGLAHADLPEETPVQFNDSIQDAEKASETNQQELLKEELLNSEEGEIDQLTRLDELDGAAALEDLPVDSYFDADEPMGATDDAEDNNLGSGLAYSAPLIEAEEMSEADEEMSIMMDKTSVEDESNEMVVEEVVEQRDENKIVRSELKEKDRKNKDKSLTLRSASQKKDNNAMERNRLTDMEPGVAEVEDGIAVTTSPSSNNGAVSEKGEWIKPKALHINKTQELNALFFIER